MLAHELSHPESVVGGILLHSSIYINFSVIYSVILLLLFLYFYYKTNMILSNVLCWEKKN